jgi:hypothetical protein
MSGFVITHWLFGLAISRSLFVAGTCALLVYAIERLIMISPHKWYVSATRLCIALLAAVLSACALDLCLFASEIRSQLHTDGRQALTAQYDARLEQASHSVERAQNAWEAAQKAENCEANGSCGSHRSLPGKIWRVLHDQTLERRADYLGAERTRDELEAKKAAALAELATSQSVIRDAGLLARLDALHRFMRAHVTAFHVWLVFFALIVLMEMVVLLVKATFGETVDDRIDALRDRLSDHRAVEYVEALTTPAGQARNLINRGP